MHLQPLSSEGSLSYHTYCDTRLPFIMVISEDPWHSHLFRAFSSGAVTRRHLFHTWATLTNKWYLARDPTPLKARGVRSLVRYLVFLIGVAHVWNKCLCCHYLFKRQRSVTTRDWSPNPACEGSALPLSYVSSGYVINVHRILLAISHVKPVKPCNCLFSKIRITYLAHLSLSLKWALLIPICPLSIVGMGIVFVVKFSHFHLILWPEPLTNFNQTWHKALNLGPCPFPRGDNYEIAKTVWRNFKYLILQNHSASSNLAQNILRWWGFKFVQIKDPTLFQYTYEI